MRVLYVELFNFSHRRNNVWRIEFSFDSQVNAFYRAGQHIATGYNCVRSSLETYFLSKQESLSTQQTNEVQVLIQRFGNPSPIRPRNAMKLTASSGMSALGLILTYLVVLVQFKANEIGCHSINSRGTSVQ